jgi:hypothetical protein
MTTPQDILPQRRSLLSSSLAAEKRQRAFFNINEVIEDENFIEHPEPELLASSVGVDGRMIPSTSTISLLSLNQQHQQAQQQQQTIQQSHDFYQSPKSLNGSSYLIRKNSMASYSNLQRLQPYQKLTSPPAPPDYIHSSTTNSININHHNGIPIPDSPNLDPVSLGGSPSRFWLSSQTPPISTNNSFKSRPTVAVHGNGNCSPVLHPVQTPIEELPMTPLLLNSRNDYFARVGRVSEGEEEDDDEEGQQDRF